DPMPASKIAQSMEIVGSNTISITDVLVGEVWICGGQSNMEWTINGTDDPAREKADANRPTLRLIKAPHVTSNVEASDIPASWTVCSPETVGGFTAIGFTFARDLQDALDVPVGLLSINWGGTRIEPWISSKSLLAADLSADRMRQMKSAIDTHRGMSEAERFELDQLRRNEHARSVVGYIDRQLASDPGVPGGWMLPKTDVSAWPTAELPRLWKAIDESLATFDGAVWFRRQIEIPDDWTGRNLLMELGPIDDSDIVWFNGARIASSVEAWPQPRKYRVPSALVKKGEATIVVMVIDSGGAGGWGGRAADLKLGVMDRKAADPATISLAGEWNWKQGAAHEGSRPTAAPGDLREPGLQRTDYAALYNGMLAPFAPYAVRGAIWYQGESNAGEPERYREFMPMLIKDWQATFEREEFPFGIVQLAAFMAVRDDLPAEGNWALLREAQSMTARDLPDVGIVITTDIGDARDIHPRNKRTVGRRLSLWALAEAYDQWRTDGYESPSFQKVEKVNGPAGGKALRITFTQTGTGLKTRDGKELGGFALSGPDGRFQWADAKIEEGGRSVLVWSAEVPDPAEVCFAWQNNPVRANLVNSAGLPADPFRGGSN
ncbi:MAG: hypothetical protein OSA40_13870, partial [Phycisphaerales bacterium]|nr:hypothetical protein [Phycisphaerales bacterium]